MEGDVRRQKIMDILSSSKGPVSGSEFSSLLHVSRQIIVQDIALLRAVNKNILSTNKGYLLYNNEPRRVKRIFHVKHSNTEIANELQIIVDHNGKVLDVVIEHEVYGQITVDLIIASRTDIQEFLTKISDNPTARPLNILTSGFHYHTVEADTLKELDTIEKELRKQGFLVE